MGPVICENDVRQECLLLAPHLECTLLRNNSGAMTNTTGRLVRFGLGHTSARLNKVFKSSDLIGWRWRDGRFLAFECKDPLWTGWRLSEDEQAQANFMTAVARGGGIAAFITHPEQLRGLVCL